MLKHGFESAETPGIALFMHHEFEPIRLQRPHDEYDFEKLVTWLTQKYVQTKMMWGQRAYQIINLMKANAILYLVPSS